MKKIFYTVFAFVMALLLVGKAEAIEGDGVCDLQEKSELRSMAANVSVSYSAVTIDSNDVDDMSGGEKLDVKIFNLNSKLKVNMIDLSNYHSETLTAEKMGSDGAITVRLPAPINVVKMGFYVYALEGDCAGTQLKAMKLTLPKYNYYSSYGQCLDIPEYYLCQKYTTYDVDLEKFLKGVDEYRAKLDEKADEKTEEENTGVVSKTINNINKFKYVIAGVIVLVGIGITVYVIKKKRSAL